MNSQLPLQVADLEIGFGARTVARNISFEVHEGEFVTVMGENGSGKSTLIDTLLGTVPKKNGQILFWGRTHQAQTRAEVNSRTGWVLSQREHIPFWLTVNAILRVAKLVYPTWDDELCDSLTQRFQLDRRKRFGHLSTGEQSKLRLTKALSFRPKLLILDELTANLSEPSKQVVTETLLEAFATTQMSVLYVSHSQEEAFRLSDRILDFSSHGVSERIKGAKS